MASDHIRAVRRAVIYRLLNTSSITDLVGNRSYGMRVPASPTWPFIKYSDPRGGPFDPTGWDGSSGEFELRIFAQDEDACENICRAVQQLFDDDQLPLEGGVKLAMVDWQSTQIMHVENDFQGIMKFSVSTYEDA